MTKKEENKEGKLSMQLKSKSGKKTIKDNTRFKRIQNQDRQPNKGRVQAKGRARPSRVLVFPGNFPSNPRG